MKNMILLILLLMFSSPSWAALTNTTIPVTKNGASNPPTLQNGSITDLGTSSGAGNVGIGSVNPSQALDVTGKIRSTALTASTPVIADSSKNLTSGSYSGNTTTLATTTGSLTSGNCVNIDASGNLKDAGTTCGGSAIYNVKASPYNATGDGLTNDTTAIQAAFTAANVSGGTVYFPAGTYSVTNLSYYPNTSILGDTRNSSILQARTGSTKILSYINSTTWPLPDSENYIANIGFDGNNISNVIGLYQEGLHNWHWDNLSAFNCNIGIESIGEFSGSISNSYIYSNVIGINLDQASVGGHDESPNEISLNNISFRYNTSWAIKWNKGSSLIGDWIDIEQNGTSGDSTTGGIDVENVNLVADHLGLILHNSWFESQWGDADIYINTPDNQNRTLFIDKTYFGGAAVSGTTATYYVDCPSSLCGLSIKDSSMASGGFVTNAINTAGKVIIDNVDISLGAIAGGGAVQRISYSSNFINFLSNIGIGSANPEQALVVAGTAKATTFSGSAANLTAIPAANVSGVIPVSNLATGTPDGTKFVRDDGTLAVPPGTGGGLSGMTTNKIQKAGTSTTLADSVIWDNGTNVGIGTQNPQAVFTIGSTGALQTNGSTTTITASNTTTNPFTLTANSLTSGNAMSITSSSSSDTGSLVTYNLSNASATGSTLTIQNAGSGPGIKVITGNVGIGSATPGQKLDVVGTVRIIGGSGSASTAACWCADGQRLGHATACATVVASGGCTCADASGSTC